MASFSSLTLHGGISRKRGHLQLGLSCEEDANTQTEVRPETRGKLESRIVCSLTHTHRATETCGVPGSKQLLGIRSRTAWEDADNRNS
jgi:hypothetical protein